MGWLLVVGVVVVLAFFVACAVMAEGDGCPRCGHAGGLDDRGRHCGNDDSYSGWGRDACDCVSDYHWNYEATMPV